MLHSIGKLPSPQHIISVIILFQYISGDNDPNLICLHGAGHSGLSFVPLVLINNNYWVISFDFRGQIVWDKNQDLDT